MADIKNIRFYDSIFSPMVALIEQGQKTMRAPNSSSSPVVSLMETVIRFASQLRAAGERRRVVHSLASLDDHMLRDIGLTRFDVDAALVQPAATDATLVLAERARASRQHQRAMAQEAQAWAALMPEIEDRRVQPLTRVA